MTAEEFDDEEDEEDLNSKPKSSGGFFSKYFSVLSNRELTEENIDPVLDQFRDHLVAKNVATEIATQV